MSDITILYAGVFCFGFIVLGFVFTFIEFRQMRRQPDEDHSGSPRLSPERLARDTASGQ